MKKILCVIFVLLLTIPVSTGAFIDTAGTQYEQAVELLCDLGIAEGVAADYFEPASTLTRAEAVTFITRVMGLEVSGAPLFADVPSTHWAYNTVYAAYTAGIVQGVSETEFAPDAPVSYAQAVKMAVCLLGYDAQAQAQGGYPSGYLASAAQLGILKGVADTDALCRGDMARMLYNALEVPMLVKASYGSDDGAYVQSETHTLLSTYLHVYKQNGKITATPQFSLTDSKLPQNGKVAIDGTLVSIGKTDATAYFGQAVTAYIKEDAENTIVSLHPNKQAKKLTVNGDDVLPSTTKTRVVCESGADRAETSYSVATNAVMVYNGRPRQNWTAQDLQFKNGTVTLLQNNGSDTDIILVEEYKNYIVESVSTPDNCIYLKDNSDNLNELATDDGKTYVFMLTDGTETTIDGCATDDVLSVFGGGDIVKVICSNKKAIGTVSELSDDTVVLDGKEYSCSDDLRVEIGYTGVFSLDYCGKIAEVGDETAESGAYGWLVAASADKGLSKNPKLKIFTEAGVMQTFDVAESVRINDFTVKSDVLLSGTAAAATQAEINKFYTAGKIAEQLVLYKTNADGALTELQTAVDGEQMDPAQREDVFSLDVKDFSAQYIGVKLTIFGAKYFLGDTKIFFIPDEYTGNNEQDYGVATNAALSHGGGYNNAMLYDLDIVNSAAVMVLRQARSLTDLYYQQCAVITDIGEGMMPDGTVCTVVKTVGKDNATEKTLYDTDEIDVVFRATVITDSTKEPLSGTVGGVQTLREKIKVTDLKRGDVVKYLTAGDDTLISMCAVFRANTPMIAEYAIRNESGAFAISETADYYNTVYLYTELEAVGDLTYKYMQPHEHVHTFGSAVILEYDLEKETCKTITKEQLRRGDRIFATRNSGNERLIIRYSGHAM